MPERAIRTLILILTFLVLSVAMAASASGQNLARRGYGKKHRGLFGFKAGIINRTDLRVDSEDNETKIGISGQTFIDVPVTPWSMLGVSIEFHDINVWGNRQVAIDLGANLKFPVYKRKGKPTLKPGIGVGYAYLARIVDLEATDYLSLRGSLEFIFYTEGRYAWIGELAVYGWASGGNTDVGGSLGPVVLLRFGVMY
jgi:hypothetical protein